MAINLDLMVLNIIVQIIFVSPVLWIAGRTIVGPKKAKFTDAILIVVVGVIVGTVLGALFSGIIGALIQFIIWLLIVRHYFDATWGQAITIAIIAVLAFIIIAFVLGILGFALFGIFSQTTGIL
jgi:hypothetical protein